MSYCFVPSKEVRQILLFFFLISPAAKLLILASFFPDSVPPSLFSFPCLARPKDLGSAAQTKRPTSAVLIKPKKSGDEVEGYAEVLEEIKSLLAGK